MILLESGPAKFDRYYWLVVCVVCIGFAGLCIKDGAYGYREKNRQEAERMLTRWSDPPFDLGEVPSEQDFKQLKAQGPADREAVRKALGVKPLTPKKKAVAGEEADRYASVYGMVTVPVRAGGRVDPATIIWQKWYKDKDQIRTQFYMAVLVGLLGIYLAHRFYRAATLRAVIDEDGMTYGGLRIPMVAMVSLRDYNRKGWVDLYYQAGDVERKLRIDNQKIAKFNEIIKMLCDKRGFEDPIQIAAAAREAEERAEESSPEPENADPTAAQDQATADQPAEAGDTERK